MKLAAFVCIAIPVLLVTGLLMRSARSDHFFISPSLNRSLNNSSDEEVDARGYHSFGLHHVSYADAFAALQAKGFPSGLEAVNKQGTSSISVMGDTDSVAAIRGEISALDTPTSAFHIQLQDIYAPLNILQKLGFDTQELQAGVPEGQGAADAAKLLNAVKQGLLTVSPGPNLTLADNAETTLHSQRAVLCTSPIYWSPRPVPTALAMTLKIKPHQLRQGYVNFAYQQGVSALFSQNAQQSQDKVFDDTSISGWSWANTNETVLLCSLIEEQYTNRIPGTVTFHSSGIMHLILARVTSDSDGGVAAGAAGTSATVSSYDTSRAMVSIAYLNVPAADLSKLGYSTQALPLPVRVINTSDLNNLLNTHKWQSGVSHGGVDLELQNGEMVPILEGQDAAIAPEHGRVTLQTVMKIQTLVNSDNQIAFHAELEDLPRMVGADGTSASVQCLPKRQADCLLQRNQTLLLDSHLLSRPDAPVGSRKQLQPADIVRLTIASAVVPLVINFSQH